MEHDMDEKDTVVVVAHNKMDACSSVGEVVVVVDSKEEENDDNIHAISIRRRRWWRECLIIGM